VAENLLNLSRGSPIYTPLPGSEALPRLSCLARTPTFHESIAT